MNEVFQQAIFIIDSLEEQGHEAFFVGGSVRDYLMNRELGDIDIATSATPEQIQDIFKKTIDVGAAHGTIIVVTDDSTYEVTTFRTEGTYSDFRRPDDVEFVKSLTEDLKRRDFTMNAMAMSKTGEILDPFNGKNDIAKKMIRTVGEASDRFREDALRMLRAVRFSSQLCFGLETSALRAIRRDGKLLQQVSVERKTMELEKLLKGKGLSHAIELLLESGLFQYLPYLHNKKEELLQVSKLALEKLTGRSELWTAFLYLLKAEDLEGFLSAWKLPKKLVKSVIRNITVMNRVLDKGWNKELVYHFGLERSIEAHHVLMVLGLDDQRSLQTIQDTYQVLPIHRPQDIAINGNDLVDITGKKPGKWIGQVLERIETEIVAGNLQNERIVLKEWVRSWQQRCEQNF